MALATFTSRDQCGEILIANRPMNLFSEELIADLGEAARQAREADIRALALRAEGEMFSGGADVSIFVGLSRKDADALATRALSLIMTIEDIPVPVLALIHGRCFAGALEVALACDLIWAAEGAQIGQLEAIIGAFPLAGGAQRLASRIGAARAVEMVFGARVYAAEELATWGLVSNVLPADRLADEGRALAAALGARVGKGLGRRSR
jgi:enoyl-CoA hydratase/carnithine racemase